MEYMVQLYNPITEYTREKCDALWLQMKYNDYCTVRSTRVLVEKQNKSPDETTSYQATSFLSPLRHLMSV